MTKSSALKRIAKLFILPILQVSDFETYKDFLDQMFNVDTRHIKRYRLKRNCTLVAQLYNEGGLPEKGKKVTKLLAKTYLVARYDETMPSFVDVELINRKDTRQCYRLDINYWAKFKDNLKHSPFKNERMLGNAGKHGRRNEWP